MNEIFLIEKPHVTEKTAELKKSGRYVFIVRPSATKNEIKKALRKIYGVEAVKIRTINRPVKKKRFRGSTGSQAGYKKAVITLKEGQKLDID